MSAHSGLVLILMAEQLVYRYLLRLHSGKRSVEIEQDWFPIIGAAQRFWSDYVIRVPALLQAQDATTIATWLVAGERLLRGPSSAMGRVVIYQLTPDAPLSTSALCYTLAPVAPEPYATGYSRFNRLRGLRQPESVADRNNSAWLLDDYTQLQWVVNRKKGSKYSDWVPQSVAVADLDEKYFGRNKFREPDKLQIGLKENSALTRYCFPWFVWMLEQCPELDFSVEVDRTLSYKVVAEPSGAPFCFGVTHWAKMSRWHNHKSAGMQALDWVWEDVDNLIITFLQRRQAGPGNQIYDSLRAAPAIEQEDAACILQLCHYWRVFASAMGLVMPAGDLVGEWPDVLRLWTGVYYSFNHPVPAGDVVMRKNRRECNLLISRLRQLEQWWLREFGIFDNVKWRYRRDGTLVSAMTDICDWGPGGQPPDHPSRFDSRDNEPFRELIVNYERFDDIEDWIFATINAIELLQVFWYPEHGRARLTLREMVHTLPPNYLPPNIYSPPAECLPSSIEVDPYVYSTRITRPTWTSRPGTITPENYAIVTTPPPPPPQPVRQAAPPYHSEYEEHTEPVDWLTGRAFIHGKIRDLWDAYPQKRFISRDEYHRIIYQDGDIEDPVTRM